MPRNFTRGLVALAALCCGLGPAAHAAELSYRTSWVGNTFGGAENRYVPIGVEAMYVTPDGRVFTNTPWDEAGGEISEMRDGKMVRFAGATHSWGNLGGDAITANSKYVFAGASINNEGGGLAGHADFPQKGQTWYGLTRRKLGNIGEGAPFEAGTGNLGKTASRSFLVVNAGPEKADASLRGLAASETRIFVSNPYKDRIQVFDAETLHEVTSWEVKGPGRLALASDGTLWALVDTGHAAHLVHFSAEGKPLPEKLDLPDDVQPVDLAFDPAGRLLVGDNGPRQQVLIYARDGQGWHAAKTLGVRGGIYAGRIGAVGPLRFNGLTGVGADRAGNIYVAMNGVGPRKPADFNRGTGAVFESYAPDGKRNWRLEGLLFVDGLALDPGDPGSAFSSTQRFTLDFSRHGPGSEWKYVGYTANRFRYPEDPLFNAEQHERGMPMVRRIEGKRFLFFTDMFSHYLKIYRFDERRDGETAIPSGLFTTRTEKGAWPPARPRTGEWIWRDANGNGRFDAGEYDARGRDAPESTAWWVDARGDVWSGGTVDGIRRYPLQKLDKHGNPVYDYAHARVFAMPAPFTWISRVQYDPSDDTMVISGATEERPYDKGNWNGAGYVLARYAHWSKKPELLFAVNLPLYSSKHAVESIAAEGDYIFAVEAQTGVVHVFDKHKGREVGTMKPGAEVGDTSGWIDVPMGITAYRRASGEYIVCVEEDLRGKIMMYRWTPVTAG